MARIRTIKPEFWEDEKIALLPMSCRLFYIGTWNISDDNGVFRGNPIILKSKIFPYDENLRSSEISKWLDALVEARMLIPISYENESYYKIRTFQSHQKFDARYPNYLIDNEILESLIKENENTTGTQRDHNENTTGTQHGNGNGRGSNAHTCAPPPSQKNDFEVRKNSFMNDCAAWVDVYSKDMIRAFFDYWTEPNKSKSKMKFELERTWLLERRLRTWENNDLKFNNNGRGNNKKRGCSDEELAEATRQGISRAQYNATNNED
ncbi:hypothetical protein EZS27_026289 [termite gut metagenome]|uniref:Uncharacterized protein n=1 Tax=termite gut metagenome TaxID=433724 RepID=A0A5J4QUC0_9ZZZZ